MDVDSNILGKIILLQSTIHIMKDNSAMARFVCRGLSAIPGISKIGIYIDGKYMSEQEPPSLVDVQSCHQLFTHLTDDTLNNESKVQCMHHFSRDHDLVCLKIATSIQIYGFFCARPNQLDLFEQYRPYIENTLNLVALIIENNQQKQLLLQNTENLEQAVYERTKELRRSEKRLAKLNRCFLGFGPDSVRNINDLTKICGELLTGTCALYARWSGNELNILGKWQLPSNDFSNQVMQGQICYDVIDQHPQDVLLIEDLPSSKYSGTDPIVSIFNLKSFVGKSVSFGAHNKGLIIVFFDKDSHVGIDDFNLIEIIASAIGIEEERIGKEQEKEDLENRLRQAQKMEAIGTLAGGIAHDFNNILAIILGNTELAINEIPQESSVSECLNELKVASLRAKDLIKQILNFSRKSQPKKEPLVIADLIKESLRLVRASLPTTVKISTSIPNMPDKIMANPTQMNQVLLNLCTNAAQAMKYQGELKLTLDRAINTNHEPDQVQGKMVKISVMDTGGGIDPSHLEKIYDPYFTTKEVGKGSGLGLSVVYGAVKAHEGKITVDSDLGQGTTFTVYLPTIESVVETRAEPLVPIPKGQERILFIDDEQNLVRLGIKILKFLGYQTIAKTDALDALDFFKHNADQIDLVITDMTMPELPGNELSQKMIQIRSDIPIILCTGHSEFIDWQSAKQLGIKKFLMKPLSIRNMAEAIRDVLDH